MRGRRPSQFRHLRAAYRSGLEGLGAAALTTAGVPFAYEGVKVPFTQPEKARRYTPDVLLHNGIVVELKGMFAADDRQKHLWVKEQHPDLDIRFVFSNPNARISKGSSTTYASWCAKHGYQCAKKEVPIAWTKEPPNKASLRKLAELGWTA